MRNRGERICTPRTVILGEDWRAFAPLRVEGPAFTAHPEGSDENRPTRKRGERLRTTLLRNKVRGEAASRTDHAPIFQKTN